MITLYKKARKGDKTQEWSIEVEGDKYRTTHGELGGALVTSEWTVCKPKNVGRANATTAEDQAKAEAEAKVTKKQKEGYYDSVEGSEQGLNFIEPMLAKNYNDRLNLNKNGVTFPCIVQTKFNGGRAIATAKGIFSRKGERWLAVPHIEKALKPFFDKNPDAVLDGELFNNDLREKLNEIMKLIRKTVDITQEDLKKSEEQVKFYLYDGYGYSVDTEDETLEIKNSDDYVKRSLGLALLAFDYFTKDFGCIKLTDNRIAGDHEEVMGILSEALEDKQEGVIVRLTGYPYKHGRSDSLLKLKARDSAEGKIKKINEGDGNRAGMAATMEIEMEDGRTFKATIMGTDAQRREILENQQDYLDKITTYFYNGLTGKGIPNYAQFDPDNSMGGVVDK